MLLAIALGMMPFAQPSCHPVLAATAPTAGDAWVQIVNPCGEPIVLDDYVLRYTGASFSFGAQGLSGELAPGDCLVVRDFDPQLQGGVACADAIGIFDFAASADDSPLDVVVYGDEPCESFAALIDVPVAPRPWQRLELGEDGWSIELGSDAPHCGSKVPPLELTIECTPLADLTPQEVDVLCKDTPYGRPAVCGAGGPTPENCLLLLPELTRCGLTTCDYVTCAAAFADFSCDAVPTACAAVTACFDESAC